MTFITYHYPEFSEFEHPATTLFGYVTDQLQQEIVDNQGKGFLAALANNSAAVPGLSAAGVDAAAFVLPQTFDTSKLDPPTPAPSMIPTSSPSATPTSLPSGAPSMIPTPQPSSYSCHHCSRGA